MAQCVWGAGRSGVLVGELVKIRHVGDWAGGKVAHIPSWCGCNSRSPAGSTWVSHIWVQCSTRGQAAL